MSVHYGASHDLARLISTHLFIICPNNSGSSFLKTALATSRRTWNLMREGQHTFGFAGPSSIGLRAHKRWASEPHWLQVFTDPGNYDWPAIRRSWYFQAFALDAGARVFVEKSPPFLLIVDQLAEQFRDARFLFMVRDPYAVVEGILRRSPRKWGKSIPEPDWPALAATHVLNCLTYQRRNIEGADGRGVFFSYEQMCAEPEQVARTIADLVPDIDDLNLRQRLRIKDYDEMLRNMNEQQIARLGPDVRRQINAVFAREPDVLEFFGYPFRE